MPHLYQTSFVDTAQPAPHRSARTPKDVTARRLREAITPYLDVQRLRQLAANGGDLTEALVHDAPTPEVQGLLDLLAVLLHPSERQGIRGPEDVAALFMVEMAYLDQEQLRVACLDTKHRLQRIVTVYQGSVNASLIRIGEVFKAALRLNSTAIIVCHNHPSGDGLSPSPEDVLVTRQIIEAGKLLDCEVLDHIVVGKGTWTSLRQQKLGFDA